MRRGLIALPILIPALLTHPLGAQNASNMALYQDHARTCLLTIPDTTEAFMLSSPGVMPFLETALTIGWSEQGKTVFRAGVDPSASLPLLDYHIEEAQVSYARARRKRLARTVSLTLHYSWASRTGQILRSDRCVRSIEDLILRRQVMALETPNYAETVGTIPPSRWTRRYLEPAALGAATVLTVFLFFNLRSSRASSGS